MKLIIIALFLLGTVGCAGKKKILIYPTTVETIQSENYPITYIENTELLIEFKKLNDKIDFIMDNDFRTRQKEGSIFYSISLKQLYKKQKEKK